MKNNFIGVKVDDQLFQDLEDEREWRKGEGRGAQDCSFSSIIRDALKFYLYEEEK